MKPPGWIVVVGKPYRRDGQVWQDIRVRWWHPGLWMAVLRARLGR